VSDISQPEFGERLRQRRTALGLSQKELAGGAVTASYISLLENGSRVPSLDIVVRLARLLHVAPQDLVGHKIEGLVSPPTATEPAELVTRFEARRLTEMGDLAGARTMLWASIDKLRGEDGQGERLLGYGLELLDVVAAAGEHTERLALLDELAQLEIVRHSRKVYLMLAVDRAAALRELGRLQDAQAVIRSAAEPPLDPDLTGTPEHVRMLGVQASILCELGDFGEAATVTAEMVAIAGRTGSVGVLGRAHWVAAMAYARMGRVGDAYVEMVEAHKTLIPSSMTVRDWLRFCRFTASILIEGEHDLDEARKWIEAAEVGAEMAGLVGDQHAAMRERAHYALAVGDPAAAAEIFRTLVNADNVMGGELTVALLGLGEALQQLKKPAEAIEWLRRAAGRFEEDGNYRKATEIWRKIDVLRQAAPRAGGERPPPPRAGGDAGRARRPKR